MKVPIVILVYDYDEPAVVQTAEAGSGKPLLTLAEVVMGDVAIFEPCLTLVITGEQDQSLVLLRIMGVRVAVNEKQSARRQLDHIGIL